MTTLLLRGRHGRRLPRWSAATARVAFVLSALTACHNGADFANTATPVTRSVLELRAGLASGDTTQLVIALGAGPTTSLGSLTGEVRGVDGWSFVKCEGAQGAPLLACKQSAQGVKVAAAWVAGTNTGPLVTLTMVRTSPAASLDWQFTVDEAHGVSGRQLLDSLDVRPAVVR